MDRAGQPQQSNDIDFYLPLRTCNPTYQHILYLMMIVIGRHSP